MSDEFKNLFLLLITHYSSLITSLLSCLDGESCVSPGVYAAEEGGRVIITLLVEYLRRTGAGVLGRSSAVGDNHFVTRQFV
jgi:hypothetical protein